jgi:Ca2+-binding RTX toxin-like protein
MAHVEIFDGYDMGSFRQSELIGSTVLHLDSTFQVFSWSSDRYGLGLAGVGFTYGGPNGTLLTGGIVQSVTLACPEGRITVTGASALGATVGSAYTLNDTRISEAALLDGDDDIHVVDGTPPTSTPNADHTYLIYGYAGNDLIVGGGASSTIYGGTGADTVQAASAAAGYLRGDEGDDSIRGGAGFDDINGNMGDDTCVSGGGNDWVVGGKDNDSLVGSAGANLVYGNLGNDTCEGGDGADVVRGGQDNDLVSGGAGNDFVSGDKGDDTMTGGAGADLFHTFGDAGIDRVLDFSLAQGDRVQLDPGTQFTVSQIGADTVINMTGGGQMTLVGVTMSTLTPGWIFGA